MSNPPSTHSLGRPKLCWNVKTPEKQTSYTSGFIAIAVASLQLRHHKAARGLQLLYDSIQFCNCYGPGCNCGGYIFNCDGPGKNKIYTVLTIDFFPKTHRRPSSPYPNHPTCSKTLYGPMGSLKSRNMMQILKKRGSLLYHQIYHLHQIDPEIRTNAGLTAGNRKGPCCSRVFSFLGNHCYT